MNATEEKSRGGFQQFDLSKSLKRAVVRAGYTEPRPIQVQTIPAALQGRDVLGLAQTGTGKTAAFALPILQNILTHRGLGPRALIIAPTRELVVQIDGEFRKLAANSRIRTVTIYGGVSDKGQISKLRQHPEILVACPGRLLDLIRQDVIHLDRIETLVLDEADHMFDMGFLPDIRRILRALPSDRQNLLFAATMPKEIRGLAEDILDDPLVAEINHSRPAETIDHALYPVVEKRKMDMLEHFLGQEDFVSAIVFTRTKHRAKRLALKLEKRGHTAVALQGNMSQGQRDRAMKGFRDRRFDILVATDIVARGIDVDQVSHVINFDVPNTPEAYMHRIGRTGRSERTGKAYTFVTTDDTEVVGSIQRKLGKPIELCSVPGFEEVFLQRTTGKKKKRSSRRPSRSGGFHGESRRGGERSERGGFDRDDRGPRGGRRRGGGGPGRRKKRSRRSSRSSRSGSTGSSGSKR